MNHLYAYAANETDFTHNGLVGSLMPTSAKFEEQAGGMSELTIEHPLDEYGKYKGLESGNVIRALVPVRTTPDIKGATIVTSVIKATVKTTATKNERYIYSKKENGKKKKLVPAGTSVTVVENPPDVERYKIKSGKYGSGWIAKSALELHETVELPNDSCGIEASEGAWSVRDQLFRIYSAERQMRDSGFVIVAQCRHITYDLLYNLTDFSDDGTLTAQTALDGVMEACTEPHEFEAYTDSTETRIGVDWPRQSPIKALLDPEVGMRARWDLEVVRDNYELFFLRRAGLERGTRIEYGKNMTGISCTVDYDQIVTRILPVGQNKDGDPIFLSGDDAKPSTKITAASFIDSPHIGDYPTPFVAVIEVSEAHINSKKGGAEVTPTIASRRLREAAEALLEQGVALPSINLTVDFVKLSETAEYERFRGLDDVFLYDTVRVRHKTLGIELDLDVVRIVFDTITGKYIEIELGRLRDTLATGGIASWQIPTIDGGKIRANTIGSGHIMAETITANMIQANVIGAEHINTVRLFATSFVAAIATIIKATIDRADIGDAHIDYADIVDLKALLVDISHATIADADIGWAHIKDLVTDTAIITDGIGGKLYISRLAVTEANMVNLTVGNLMVKGSDGQYYRLVAGPDGTVVSELVLVEGDNIADDTITGGNMLENTITAQLLNVSQIFADQALIRAIKAANLDVDEIWASSAWISKLQTLVVSTPMIEALWGKLSVYAEDLIDLRVGDTALPELSVQLTRGQALGSEIPSTEAKARVGRNGVDVTSVVPASAFSWARLSSDIEGDADWNARADHRETKSVIVKNFVDPVDQTPPDVTSSATFEVTLLGASDVFGRVVFDRDTMSLVHVDAPEVMYEVLDAELYAEQAGARLKDGALLLDTPLAEDTQTAAATVFSHTAMTYSGPTAPKGLRKSDEGALWTDTINMIIWRWTGTKWQELQVGRVKSTVVNITPETGLTVRQTLDGNTTYPTEFALDARTFGLRNISDGSYFAKAGIEKGRGYLAASRIMSMDGSNFTAELGAEYQTWLWFNANRTWRGLLMKLSGQTHLFLGVCAESGAPGVLLHTRGNSYRIQNSPGALTGGGTTYPSVRIDADCSNNMGVLRINADGVNSAWLQLSGVNGNCNVSKAWSTSSDERLKTDIEDIAVNLIDHVRPRQFRWIKGTGKLNYGVTAQELWAACEAAGLDPDDLDILTTDEDGMMGVAYEHLIAHLVDKVQRQQQQIDALTARMDALEAR